MGRYDTCPGGLDKPVGTVSLRDELMLLRSVLEVLERRLRTCHSSLTVRELLLLLTQLRGLEQLLRSLERGTEEHIASRLWTTGTTQSTTSDQRRS